MKLTIAHDVFPPEEIQQLQAYRDRQKDSRLKTRFVALLMLTEEVLIEQVGRIVGKSVKTLENWANNV